MDARRGDEVQLSFLCPCGKRIAMKVDTQRFSMSRK
jgi:hypothetical protein